jgi:hypothetical protein
VLLDGDIHALARDQRAMVAGMSRLSPAGATALQAPAPFPLATGEAIGRRRLRRQRRVLLAQRELMLQILNPLSLFGELTFSVG